MDLLNLEAPHGTAWQLLAATVVVIAAPLLAERVKVPGLIGLLAGGWLIGPDALGIVASDTGIVDELGDVGLLYLMFMAGLELDLAVFGRVRREAATFSVLTFGFPLVAGTVAGLLVGYQAAAAILIGSIFASHTLVSYPTIRRMGLAPNRAVASTVGATVVTDTLALVVLAVVAGSAAGDASGLELAVQVTLGLLVLLVWCFLVLPRLARWFFVAVSQQRTLRYVFVLAALLSGATLAEVVGVESIVGAFFAGLALNRLVPNEGGFMERIEFFGSSLLIPMFLVSVGTVIDMGVMVQPATLGLAGVFVLACVGGKAAAAALGRPLFRFTRDEVGVVFSLSVAQAAATLAATFVGLEVGLLTTTTVNAVMVVVVVTLVLSSLAASRFGPRIPVPEVDTSRLGRSVLVHVDEADDTMATVSVAMRVAQPDGGVVRPVVVVAEGEATPARTLIEELESGVAALGIDAEVEVRVDRGTTDGLVHAAAGHGASLIVVAAATEAWLPTLLGAAHHELVATSSCPVAIVRPGSQPPVRVVLALQAAQARRPTTAARAALELTTRLARSGLPLLVVAADDIDERLDLPDGTDVVRAVPAAWVATAAPGDLVVLPGGRNGALGTARTVRAATPRGCGLVVVADRASVAAADAANRTLGLTVGRSAAREHAPLVAS